MAENIRVTSGTIRRLHVACSPMPGEVLLTVRDLDAPDRWIQVALSAAYLAQIHQQATRLTTLSAELYQGDVDENQQTPLSDTGGKI